MGRNITTEKQVYARLKRRWPNADWQRFENTFGQGIPDTNMCCAYGEFWFECKVGKKGRHNTLTVDLSPRQRAWIKRRIDAYGQVMIAIAVDDDIIITHGSDLHRVSNKDDLSAWVSISTPLENCLLGPP